MSDLASGHKNLSDAALIDHSQRGDHRAFSVLWERYAPRVQRVLRRFAEQPADIDDLAQDVSLKVFIGLRRFRGDSEFFSWVYRIAFNTGINFCKASHRCERTNVENVDVLGELDPERTYISAERQKATESAIVGLSPVLRQALLLNTVRGFDYESVSSLVGCPVGTVRSRISRARSNLSVALAE